MPHRLIIAGFSGLLAGLLAGALDGLGRPPLAAVSGAGLMGVLGAALGVIATLCLPHRAHADADSGDEAIELHTRCVQFARIWLIALGVPTVLIALRAAFPILLGRIQSPVFGAVAAAMLALVSTGIALAVAIAVGAALARGAEQLVRRRPELTRWLDRRAHLLAGGAVMFTALALGGLPMLIPVFGATAVTIAGGRRVRSARPAVAAVMGLAAIAALIAGLGQLGEAGPLARLGAQLFGLS